MSETWSPLLLTVLGPLLECMSLTPWALNHCLLFWNQIWTALGVMASCSASCILTEAEGIGFSLKARHSTSTWDVLGRGLLLGSELPSRSVIMAERGRRSPEEEVVGAVEVGKDAEEEEEGKEEEEAGWVGSGLEDLEGDWEGEETAE